MLLCRMMGTYFACHRKRRRRSGACWISCKRSWAPSASRSLRRAHPPKISHHHADDRTISVLMYVKWSQPGRSTKGVKQVLSGLTSRACTCLSAICQSKLHHTEPYSYLRRAEPGAKPHVIQKFLMGKRRYSCQHGQRRVWAATSSGTRRRQRSSELLNLKPGPMPSTRQTEPFMVRRPLSYCQCICSLPRKLGIPASTLCVFAVF